MIYIEGKPQTKQRDRQTYKLLWLSELVKCAALKFIPFPLVIRTVFCNIWHFPMRSLTLPCYVGMGMCVCVVLCVCVCVVRSSHGPSALRIALRIKSSSLVASHPLSPSPSFSCFLLLFLDFFLYLFPSR